MLKREEFNDLAIENQKGAIKRKKDEREFGEQGLEHYTRFC